jgi:hypothetical protein
MTSARLEAPGALVHVGDRPVVTASEGSGLLARLVPDASFRAAVA